MFQNANKFKKMKIYILKMINKEKKKKIVEQKNILNTI